MKKFRKTTEIWRDEILHRVDEEIVYAEDKPSWEEGSDGDQDIIIYYEEIEEGNQ